MPEKIEYHNLASNDDQASPETPNQEPSSPDQLVDQAVASFEAKNYDALDEYLLKLGQELGVELETKYDEALKSSQKVVDFIFGEGKVNLKQEYLEGRIILPQPDQERQAKKEKLSMAVIFPGGISRDEFLTAFKTKYTSEFNSQGVYYWGEAVNDLNQTKAVQDPDRPNQPYLMLVSPQTEVDEAQLPNLETTINKTPEQAEQILNQKQTQNPELNLKGMTLPEYLFLDCAHYLKTGKHLDENHYSYLLGEKVPTTQRALDAIWLSVGRKVSVGSVSDANDFRGSRFVAVSAPSGASS